MKYNTSFNSVPRESTAYKSNKPSKAVPGQAYSIAQAIERLRAGLPIKALNVGYNPDGYPVMDDLTSLEQMKRIVDSKQEKITARIEAAKAKKEAEERSDKADT